MRQSNLYRGPKKVPDAVPKRDQSSGFAKMPRTVIFDTELSASARCVFGALAMSDAVAYQKSRVVSIGVRLLAKQLGFERKAVMRGVRELIARGHLNVSRNGARRATYTLMSPEFEVQADGVRESGPFTNRRVLREWVEGTKEVA